MTKAEQGREFSQEEILKFVPPLMERAIKLLGKTPEFTQELVERYLDLRHQGNDVSFERNGYNYAVVRTNDLLQDRLEVSRNKGTIKETAVIALEFDGKFGDGSRNWGGRRGALVKGEVLHQLLDWGKDGKLVQTSNTLEAFDKVETFFSRL